ncbi:MAG: DUF6445 family protein [Pseudomonadota bacterium]
MKPELRRVGNSQSPVVVIDEFSGSAEDIARIADALAPYPPITKNYYPGVRRPIAPTDGPAYDYAIRSCEKAAPFVGGAFDVDAFDLTEASFSIVTVQPDDLQPAQRAPHFDSSDQNVFAMLHFLRVPPGSGTAFYRHRSTGVERVTEENFNRFVYAARADAARLAADSGYINSSDEYYEQIDMVEALPDRLIIYHGSLLHSGVIPPGMTFSVDPREGRLTGNYFIYGRQGAKPNG